ncbi:hypothetical protein PpBr36_02276 [Pyricularia pennisetigena]|uniref:hypothetical protein n=1 Tax=Pyricularia pennisetigena TaxID=1578925 RepID=UPI00114E7801|nr:hypothetical protein PpBr36_02276 [Pyricularia pennisetigena]TLS30895.1 hypothetical protein PpBr36_02276 [Pyricularia pennisetigena]
MSAEDNQTCIGEFTVQPVCRALPCSGLPPVVVRTDNFMRGADAVVGMCMLLEQDGKTPVENVVDASGNSLESFFNVNQGAGLQCHASEPVFDLKLFSKTASRRGGGSSSSSAAAAASGKKSIYFGFSGLAIAWPGTYTLAVYVWVYPRPGPNGEAPEPYFAGQVVSEPIEVADGEDPEERPTKEEKRILSRMRNMAIMSHFNIPHQ